MKIVIKSYKDESIIKEIDLNGKSDHQIDKIEDGMNINLDHENYYTLIVDED